MLEIKNLNKKFGRKTVINGLNFSFDNGVYGLLGPNGAGKTTLIRCLTLLYPIEKEAIYWQGSSIVHNKSYLSHVGYLPQKFGLFKDLSVYEMMQMLCNLKEVPKAERTAVIEEALEQVNLSDRIKSRVGSLSGGMMRRLGIAQALLNKPDIIIFDEPTAGLDPEERLRFKNIISEIKGKQIILISTHIVEDVESICDKVAVINQGKIIASGTCQEIESHGKGKVYNVPEDKLNLVRGSYQIQKHFENDGVRMIKLLSAEPQDFDSVPPNVEDGYICILKNI